jgi:hypothetical protein
MRKPMTTLWTEDEIKRLSEFVRSGATPLRVAAALRRSMVSVKAKARLLGTPFPTEKKQKKLRAARYAAAVNQADLGIQK